MQKGEQMSDLINRGDAIRLAEQGQIQGFEWQFKKLCELSSVQHRKGKWIYYDPNGFKCSECGGYLEIGVGDVKMNFCPNCGSYNGGE